MLNHRALSPEPLCVAVSSSTAKWGGGDDDDDEEGICVCLCAVNACWCSFAYVCLCGIANGEQLREGEPDV